MDLAKVRTRAGTFGAVGPVDKKKGAEAGEDGRGVVIGCGFDDNLDDGGHVCLRGSRASVGGGEGVNKAGPAEGTE